MNQIKFICPECHSNHFGSSRDNDMVLYHCHGDKCTFTIPEHSFWTCMFDVHSFDSRKHFEESAGYGKEFIARDSK